MTRFALTAIGNGIGSVMRDEVCYVLVGIHYALDRFLVGFDDEIQYEVGDIDGLISRDVTKRGKMPFRCRTASCKDDLKQQGHMQHSRCG